MYIPYQFLVAIENDRQRSLERQHLRQAASRQGTAAGRAPRTRKLRRVTRALSRRAAAGAAA